MSYKKEIIPTVKIGEYIIELKESVNCIKKYQFVEDSVKGKVRYRNGFTEIRPFGKFRYFIRHTVSDTWHVTNIEDMEIYVKNFLRMDGY